MNPAPPPPRLLMTTDAVGGVWNYSVSLCRGLQHTGAEILLATLGPRPGDAQRSAITALPHVTLCESDFALEWMDDPWADVAASGEWLLDLERDFCPDVIHLNGYCHGALPWNAPVVIAAHSCVLSWWEAVHHAPAPATWRLYRDNVRRGLRAAQRVVAPTAAMLAALERHYGPLPSASVIFNGVDPRRFRGDRAKENFVLSVGRFWDAAKNLASLVDAAPRLPWPVHLAGELAPPGGVPRAIASPNLHLHPRLAAPELAALYARASVYALPARYEPFGLSILEAALSGCALVIGDIPSLRELWDGAACFVPPDEPAALEQALAALIAAPDRRAFLAERAHARALTYDAASMTSAYARLYGALLAHPLAALS